MTNEINECMFEFAMTVSRAISRGYKFVGINYGEHRLGIRSSLKLNKDGKDFICYSPEDLESLLNKDMENE